MLKTIDDVLERQSQESRDIAAVITACTRQPALVRPAWRRPLVPQFSRAEQHSAKQRHIVFAHDSVMVELVPGKVKGQPSHRAVVAVDQLFEGCAEVS